MCRGIVYAMMCVQRYEDKSHSEGQLNLLVGPEGSFQEFKYICGADGLECGLEWVARALRSLT